MTAPAQGSGLDRLLVQVAAAMNTRTLYASTHPRVATAIEGVLSSLSAACVELRQTEVTLLIVGDDLVFNERPLRTLGVFQQNFVQSLRRRGVERLTLSRDLPKEECEQFVTAMAEGRAPASTAHLVVGRVEMATVEDEGGGGAQPVTAGQLNDAREAFGRFRGDRRGSIHKMEEVVWSLMESLARNAHDTLILAPLKDHDEYTFVHSVNVSMLVMAQARAFGLEGPMLHTIGVAAACHDIGKLDIPGEVLRKPGRLDEKEWTVMRQHAELGAWRLAETTNAPALALLVAYEHHLRWDGRPSYPLISRPVKPSLASQLTSIADTFDAVCTVRPYQAAVARPVALAVLRDRAGSFLDPALVATFHRLMGEPVPL